MNNLYWFPYVDLVSAFGTMGLLEQARQPLAELKKLSVRLHSAVAPRVRLRNLK